MTHVYSRDGSAEFNEKLHQTLSTMADKVEQVLGDNLTALILGGGYGRGEGGVILVDGAEMPYNDLDLTLMVVRKSKIPWTGLQSVGNTFAKELHIHVDFSRPLTIQDVEKWPNWLMWHDLVNGHVVLKGPSDILISHAPSAVREQLPTIEGTRLLLNRGAGLLWALKIVRNSEKEPDNDFIRRNYYKCALALGDALLIAYRCYTTKYFGRDSLFRDLQYKRPALVSFDLLPLYNEALRFKFRPDQLPYTPKNEDDLMSLAEVWGMVFLHVEKVRTGQRWTSLDEYVNWPGIRENDQHTLSVLFRNFARNLQGGKLGLRYPREILYRQLPILLGLVKPKAGDWPKETNRFLSVWDKFN